MQASKRGTESFRRRGSQMTRLRVALSAVLRLAGLVSVSAFTTPASARSAAAPPYRNLMSLILPSGARGELCRPVRASRVGGRGDELVSLLHF
jgi:hypothetical protein